MSSVGPSSELSNLRVVLGPHSPFSIGVRTEKVFRTVPNLTVT